MFTTLRWTWATLVLSILLGLVMAALFASRVAGAFAQFPNDNYVWSELLISYGGGFVRRGLLGELAYLLQPYVAAQFFLTGLMLVLYLAVAARSIALSLGNLTFPGLLFLLSPGALLMPAGDFGAIERKDIVLIAAFMLALTAVKHLRSPMAGLAAVLAIYVVAGLVQEAAWLFLPLALSFLLQTRGRGLRRSARLTGLAIVVVYFVAMLAITVAFRGSADVITGIVTAWQRYVPNAFEPLRALQFLNYSIGQEMALVARDVFTIWTVAGYVLAFALTGLPLILHLQQRPPALAADRLNAVVLASALVPMLALYVIASDWGRWSYLLWMHVFIYFASIAPRSEWKVPTWLWQPRSVTWWAGVAVLLLYVLTWRVRPAVVRGASFAPGHLFALLGTQLPD